MPYQADWLIPDRVMLLKYIGVLTSEDVKHCLDETLNMRDEANARLGEYGPLVHTITDATGLESYALRLPDMKSMLTSLRDQRVGWSIFVHPSRAERFMAAVGHHWVGVRHREVATMAEALKFLKSDTTVSEAIDQILEEMVTG